MTHCLTMSTILAAKFLSLLWLLRAVEAGRPTGPRPCSVRWKTRFLIFTVTSSRLVGYPAEVLEQPYTELFSRHHLTNCPKKPNAQSIALIFHEGLTNARDSRSCTEIFWPRWSGRCCYLIWFSGLFPFLQ